MPEKPKSKKIVVIGGVAGGMSFAARTRRLDALADITVFERGRDVAFSNCALPYHLSGMIENAEDLILLTPEVFQSRFNINALTRHEVTAINRDTQTVTVKNLETGDHFNENYDVLCLSPGASPIVPPIPGHDAANVFTVRNVVDIERLNAAVQEVNQIVVVGGGFIGLEIAENLRFAGKQVTVVEAAPQVMTRLDEDIVQLLHKELIDNGVELVLNEAITAVNPDSVIVASGRTIPAEVVVMAIGVRPEVELAKAAGLELGESGGIKVDSQFRTSDPNIYAVGDAIEEFNTITGKPMRLALAGPAQRQARAAADSAAGRPVSRTGVIGSSIVQVFDYTAGSTGLNEIDCDRAGLKYQTVYFISSNKVDIIPGASMVHLKLIFEDPTGRILGAQAVGKEGVDKRIDVIATAIKFNGTVYDLADLELAYSPLYSTAKDVVNQAALVAINQLNGDIKQVSATKLRELTDSGATIIDVRERGEWLQGHVKTAINIPISQFRDRLDEIPMDRPIYLHCKMGQRSYFVTRELNHLGFDNATNVNGAFLATCYYEYFKDQYLGREPIVSKYNFN